MDEKTGARHVDVFLGMVHNLMGKLFRQMVVSHSGIRVDRASGLDFVKDRVLQSLPLDVRHDLAAYLAKVPIQNADNRSLACAGEDASEQ